MGVFDDLIHIGENGEFLFNQWIEWDHFLIPNKPEWFRELLRNIMALFGHCMNCTSLDGCYLVTRNMPEQPLHDNCDCRKKDITYSNVIYSAIAECDIKKFTEYVFKNVKDSKGKNKIFYDLGFDINDSEYLQNEYCKQALKQYLLGNYIRKNLDRRGLRLAIPTTLSGITFYSGWMLYPEGKIKNTTPFGGWIK
ncbi:MAG: hypothetical protein ACI4T1_01805 [Christensenellales bacterium]